jgi:hypothetical protein
MRTVVFAAVLVGCGPSEPTPRVPRKPKPEYSTVGTAFASVNRGYPSAPSRPRPAPNAKPTATGTVRTPERPKPEPLSGQSSDRKMYASAEGLAAALSEMGTPSWRIGVADGYRGFEATFDARGANQRIVVITHTLFGEPEVYLGYEICAGMQSVKMTRIATEGHVVTWAANVGTNGTPAKFCVSVTRMERELFKHEVHVLFYQR